jgi:1-deoxy-D-xylulose-5-phosphate reductoisomerase
VEVLTGARGLAEAASRLEFDVMLNALVGIAGLAPTLAFLGRRDASGRALALANKETLVTAGGIVMRAAQDAGVDVVPVDSEHSAIYQCLHGRDAAGVRRVLLTASGGPFRGFDEAQLRAVTPEQALAHPTWRMGAKITVDSATMMNKAFEVIEAKWLFGLAPEQVDVVIHPQSIVHSFVEFADGAMLAQLGTPSMTVPIAYAFYAPERRDAGAGRIDPAALGALLFEEPGAQARRSLDLAYAVLREAERGFDSPGIVMNAANEELVGLFLRKRICFVDIIEGTERMLERHAPARSGSAEEIFALDRQVRQEIRAAFGAVEE